MKKRLFLLHVLIALAKPIAAQQNWAAIPCFDLSAPSAVDRIFVDSIHNELILVSGYGHKICNSTFKGLVAYNGNGFHDLDFGVNKFNPNPGNGGLSAMGCIPYHNKTIFGGYFYTVGSDTLYAKSIALWNGAVWDTFPQRCFSNNMNNAGGGFWGFLKDNGKLWMYGGFDTIGSTLSKNLVAYDGNTFIAVPSIPASNYTPINKMIVYKNKLIAGGNFYDYPSFAFSRLAQFDGTSWAQVGNGIQGGIAFVYDMAIYDDTLYISGTWSKADGNPGNYIVKWDGSQLTDAGFGNLWCGYGNVKCLIPFHNRLYAFGNFGCGADQPAHGVAYLENGTWTIPQDSIGFYSINTAAVYNDEIYIGGAFASINGDSSINKFAKLICPNFDAASGCVSSIKKSTHKLDLKIFPNPSNNKLYLETEQSVAIDKVTIINTLGQQVLSLLKPAPKQEIDISHLPAGIYFIKAENKGGQGVFKVFKE